MTAATAHSDNVRRVVRASAFYDLIVTAGFATPWTAAAALGTISDLHRWLGFDGALPVIDDPFTMLFANLLGSIVVVWSVIRLLRPTALLGAGDTAGRLLSRRGSPGRWPRAPRRSSWGSWCWRSAGAWSRVSRSGSR